MKQVRGFWSDNNRNSIRAQPDFPSLHSDLHIHVSTFHSSVAQEGWTIHSILPGGGEGNQLDGRLL